MLFQSVSVLLEPQFTVFSTVKLQLHLPTLSRCHAHCCCPYLFLSCRPHERRTQLVKPASPYSETNPPFLTPDTSIQTDASHHYEVIVKWRSHGLSKVNIWSPDLLLSSSDPRTQRRALQRTFRFLSLAPLWIVNGISSKSSTTANRGMYDCLIVALVTLESRVVSEVSTGRNVTKVWQWSMVNPQIL